MSMLDKEVSQAHQIVFVYRFAFAKRFVNASKCQKTINQVGATTCLAADAQKRLIVQRIGFEVQQEAAKMLLCPVRIIGTASFRIGLSNCCIHPTGNGFTFLGSSVLQQQVRRAFSYTNAASLYVIAIRRKKCAQDLLAQRFVVWYFLQVRGQFIKACSDKDRKITVFIVIGASLGKD